MDDQPTSGHPYPNASLCDDPSTEGSRQGQQLFVRAKVGRKVKRLMDAKRMHHLASLLALDFPDHEIDRLLDDRNAYWTTPLTVSEAVGFLGGGITAEALRQKRYREKPACWSEERKVFTSRIALLAWAATGGDT